MYLTFDHPEYFIYLLSIPVLIATHFAFLKYTKRKALRFANFQALKKVSDQKVLTKNHTILFIRILILVCVIFAIAGTTIWYTGITNENDYVIAIDTSSSMTTKDITPSRFDAAKQYSKDFLNNLQTDSSVSIITFSGAAFIETVPSKSKSDVSQIIDNLGISDIEGTNIPDAVVTGTNLLLSSKRGRTMVLLTDGSDTVSSFVRDPVQSSIDYAKKNNVIINTIGIGTNTGPIGYLPEYYNISAVSDPQILMRIANGTGGQYYDAANNSDMQAAFGKILGKSKEALIPIDLTIPLMIAVLVLIFLDWGLISTRFRSLP